MFEKDLGLLELLESQAMEPSQFFCSKTFFEKANSGNYYDKSADLKKLTDDALEIGAEYLFKVEIKLNKNILDHLSEMDRRELYLKAGYKNFCDYLQKRFKVEGGSAQRRIDAARLIQRIPVVSEKIQNGDLSLNQVSKFQQALRQKRKATKEKVPLKTQEEIIQKIQNLNSRQTDLVLAQELDFKIEKQTNQKIQKDESVRVEITFNKEECEILTQAKNILSHKAFGDIKCTILKMAEKTIKDSQPKIKSPKPQNLNQIQKSTSARGNKKSGNHIKVTSPRLGSGDFQNQQDNLFLNSPGLSDTTEDKINLKSAQVPGAKPTKTLTPKTKREILAMQPTCQYKNHKTGKVCGATLFLEVDHIQPKFACGTNEVTNLRTLCRAHNRFRYVNER